MSSRKKSYHSDSSTDEAEERSPHKLANKRSSYTSPQPHARLKPGVSTSSDNELPSNMYTQFVKSHSIASDEKYDQISTNTSEEDDEIGNTHLHRSLSTGTISKRFKQEPSAKSSATGAYFAYITKQVTQKIVKSSSSIKGKFTESQTLTKIKRSIATASNTIRDNTNFVIDTIYQVMDEQSDSSSRLPTIQRGTKAPTHSDSGGQLNDDSIRSLLASSMEVSDKSLHKPSPAPPIQLLSPTLPEGASAGTKVVKTRPPTELPTEKQQESFGKSGVEPQLTLSQKSSPPKLIYTNDSPTLTIEDVINSMRLSTTLDSFNTPSASPSPSPSPTPKSSNSVPKTSTAFVQPSPQTSQPLSAPQPPPPRPRARRQNKVEPLPVTPSPTEETLRAPRPSVLPALPPAPALPALPPSIPLPALPAPKRPPALPAPPPPTTSNMSPDQSSEPIRVKKKRAGLSKFCEHLTACACGSNKYIQDIEGLPLMAPSSEDDNPYDSVFDESLENLMDLRQQLDRALLVGVSGLTSQYELLRCSRIPSYKVSQMPVHSNKNRYGDIVCMDLTRVRLEPIEDDPTTDYINASHINGFKQKRGYICCQAPLPRTSFDHWRMIWQEEVRVIAMVTRVSEKNRTKSHKYWPSLGETQTYGHFSVECGLNNPSEDIDVSSLEVTNKLTGEKRTIYHLLFLAWPDYGIPTSPKLFLEYLLLARSFQSLSLKDMGSSWAGHPRGPPLLVHCSAGVGRSGTFIVVDICIYYIEEIGKLNIQQVVTKLRTQRALAVQTTEQYLFCHLALLQYAKDKGYLPEGFDIYDIMK